VDGVAIEDALYVAFTMDCERIRKFSPPGGPETWELSERAIRGYVGALGDHGLYGTLFIVPDTAAKQGDILLEAMDEGWELAMHYHPQSFGDGRYDRYLGEYSYEAQLKQLREGLEVWSQALGLRPESFRPGNCSANEHTYRALYELGFRQGSTYIPGRRIPKFHAIWVGASPYPHHVEGMDFLEVPMTADPHEVVERGDPTHLRIEGAREEVLCSLAERWVRHLVERDCKLKVVVPITHNFIDYSDREGEHRRRLERLVEHLSRLSEELGLELKPATIKGLHELVDRAGLPI